MRAQGCILLAGEQALAILHDLLSRGTLFLRVLTRDAGLADVLRRLRVEVAEGDLDDRASIRTAVRGCDGVFAVPERADQAWNLITVAAGSEVERLVVAESDDGERHRLETYARSVGVELTFVEPASLGTAAAILARDAGESLEEKPCRSLHLAFFP